MRRIIIYIVIIVFVIGIFVVYCLVDTSDQNVPDDGIIRWTTLSNDSLYKKSRRYIENREHLDSALIGMTVIVNNIADGKQGSDELRLLVSTLTNMGYLYAFEYYDYPKAFKLLKRAEKICQDNNFEDSMLPVILNLAAISASNDYMRNPEVLSEQTLGLYKRAFRKSFITKQWRELVNVVNNLCNLSLEYGFAVDIQPELNTFLSADIPADVPMLGFARLQAQGVEAYISGDFARALQCFEGLLSKIEPGESSDRYVLMSYLAQSMACAGQQDLRQAIAVCEKAREVAQQNKYIDVEVSFLNSISKYYKLSGNRDSADAHYITYLRMNDSLIKTSNLMDVDKLQFLEDLGRVNAKMKDLSARRRMENLVMIAVAIIAGLLLVILLLIVSSYKRLKLKNRDLYERNITMLKVDKEYRDLLEKFEQQTVFSADDAAEEDPAERPECQKTRKYTTSAIDDATKQIIANRIMRVMNDPAEICAPDFSLTRLAELTGWKRNYVSQVINEVICKNFTNFLSEQRVKEACRRMSENRDEYGRYTIEAIALSVGFKSRTNFAAVFKNITGLTPSQYNKHAATTRFDG